LLEYFLGIPLGIVCAIVSWKGFLCLKIWFFAFEIRKLAPVFTDKIENKEKVGSGMNISASVGI
jgi:hypothetical protein